MNEQVFHLQVDELFLMIEKWLEDLDKDLDFETQQGILTITTPQGSQLVLSRQFALQEIWLASKIGGYHFRDTPLGWIDKNNNKLGTTLTTMLKELLASPEKTNDSQNFQDFQDFQASQNRE